MPKRSSAAALTASLPLLAGVIWRSTCSAYSSLPLGSSITRAETTAPLSSYECSNGFNRSASVGSCSFAFLSQNAQEDFELGVSDLQPKLRISSRAKSVLLVRFIDASHI